MILSDTPVAITDSGVTTSSSTSGGALYTPPPPPPLFIDIALPYSPGTVGTVAQPTAPTGTVPTGNAVAQAGCGCGGAAAPTAGPAPVSTAATPASTAESTLAAVLPSPNAPNILNTVPPWAWIVLVVALVLAVASRKHHRG